MINIKEGYLIVIGEDGNRSYRITECGMPGDIKIGQWEDGTTGVHQDSKTAKFRVQTRIDRYSFFSFPALVMLRDAKIASCLAKAHMDKYLGRPLYVKFITNELNRFKNMLTDKKTCSNLQYQ